MIQDKAVSSADMLGVVIPDSNLVREVTQLIRGRWLANAYQRRSEGVPLGTTFAQGIAIEKGAGHAGRRCDEEAQVAKSAEASGSSLQRSRNSDEPWRSTSRRRRA